MNDRELLELAAKAAGINLMDTDSQVEAIATPRYWDDVACMSVFWNPLENDGDALRLAVDVGETNLDDLLFEYYLERQADVDRDPCAVYRRAIVLAAANIGRKM